MGRKYNMGKYKKGKFDTKSGKIVRTVNGRTFTKSQIADLSKNSKNVTTNRELWASDTRKWDHPDFDMKHSESGIFKYKFRSKKKQGKKPGRENQTYRKYWYEYPEWYTKNKKKVIKKRK